jgi:hypothetical protein
MSAKSCLYIETEDKTWFYLAENEDSPEETWDWREYSTAHGPFDALDDAMDHRVDSRPDVSGCEIKQYNPNAPLPDVVRTKIDDATAAAAASKY